MIPYLADNEITQIRRDIGERHWRDVAMRWSENKWKAARLCRIDKMSNARFRVKVSEATGVIQDGPIGVVGLRYLRHRLRGAA